MAFDQVPIVGEGLGLDLNGVGIEPFVKVFAHGNGVAVDVFATSRPYPCFVAGFFGCILVGEPTDPLGFGHAGFRVGDADDVGPGLATLHHAVAQLGSLAWLARFLGVGECGSGHQAASSISVLT
jgi:hypothetical protein